MKIRDLFNYVHKLKECPFEDSELLVWLNEVEGLVHTKVFLLAPSEYKEITADDIDSDTFKLLIVGPHQKIYPAYLVAMIDFANGEYNRYANTLEMFNAHFTELQMWQRQYAGPADGECVFRGYYLSAYGIAKNRGVFNGSEEEWLASLKGDKGDSAYDIAVKLGYKGSEQEWIDHLAKAQSDAIDAARKSALEDIESNYNTADSLINFARENALQQIEETNKALSEDLNIYHSYLDDHYFHISSELNWVQVNSIGEIEESKEKAIDEIESTGSIFTNALKGKANGEAIAITDASPIEHEMGVRVRNKNLIPFPYENSAGTSITKSGVTFTTNADGSITLNGTATGNIFYSLIMPYLELQDGTYALSGGYRNDPNRAALCIRNPGNTIMASSEGKSAKYDTQTAGNIIKEAYLYIYNGSTFDNITIFPQLEEGTIATTYAPYVEDISTVKVKKYGKNLLNRNATEVSRGTLTFDGNRQTFTSVGGGGGLETIIGKYKDFVGKTITVSYTFVDYKGGHASFVTFIQADSTTLVSGYNYDKTTKLFKLTYTIPENDSAEFLKIRQYVGYITSADGDYVTIDNFQVEIGDTVTEWEEYKEPIEYPVSTDGTVEGVTPTYPTTTLMTDTAGAVIDCTYNRDINKAFEALYNAIISMGGNV